VGALEEQRWLDLRRFRALHEAGASVSEIARETGLNWRTVKKYLAADAVEVTPPQRARPVRAQVIDAFAHVVDAWLRAELLLKGTVIHERLVEQYGFTGNYQRVKLYLQQARPRIAEELGISQDQLAGLHRRFEVVSGAQAQADWGDEGGILAHVGIAKVYSFHMVLSYSRDPFCCFTTSQDLARPNRMWWPTGIFATWVTPRSRGRGRAATRPTSRATTAAPNARSSSPACRT
jgi:transposase